MHRVIEGIFVAAVGGALAIWIYAEFQSTKVPTPSTSTAVPTPRTSTAQGRIVKVSPPDGPPVSANRNVSGRWISESRPSQPVGLAPGSVFLEQQGDGKVTGYWNHRGIVEGSIEGVVRGNELTDTMHRERFDPGGKGWGDEADTSTVVNCLGTFTGLITFLGDTGLGTFEGGDCRGSVQNAAITLRWCVACKAPGRK